MNCKTCDYALWNLRTRVCPECGSPFSPADFEFAPTSVQFCCPHCNQAYYGTDAKGHLVPPEFECVTCGKPVSMDEMVVLPAAGLRESETSPHVVPWLLREDIGRFRSWFRTVGWGMGLPSQLGTSLPAQAEPRQAFTFATIVLYIAMLLCVGLFVFMIGVSGQSGSGIGPILISGFLSLAGVLVFSVALLGVVILMAHGVLRVLGEGTDGMGRTAEAICYTSGPMLIGSIPCLGVYTTLPIGWLWWMISASFALKERQKAQTWKAVVAMAVPGVVLPGIPIASIIASIWMVVSTAGGGFGPGSAVASLASQSAMSSLTMSWRMKAMQSTGPVTDHASAFMEDGFVYGGMFLSNDTILSPADVPIGSLTLADFAGGPRLFTPAQAAAVQEASDVLPMNTVAHRVGDFVFCYHGIDLTAMSPRLWVAIAWPMREAEAPLDADYTIVVGQVGSETEEIAVEDFAAALEAQNQLRSRYNLAPLPMPDTVTHEQPAVAPEK